MIVLLGGIVDHMEPPPVFHFLACSVILMIHQDWIQNLNW